MPQLPGIDAAALCQPSVTHAPPSAAARAAPHLALVQLLHCPLPPPALRIALLQIAVGGMQCSCCAVSVEKAVRALPGVRRAGVFFLAETLDVQFSPAAVTADKVLQAVRDAGFSAKLVSSTG